MFCLDDLGNLLCPLLPLDDRSVCLHWISPNSRFPIHPIPRKPHESHLSASSFMGYVESQILRVIKSSSSNVITLYSSLDCRWMCKKKIRRSTSPMHLQCTSKMAYNAEKKEGGMSHREGPAQCSVCWVRDCWTASDLGPIYTRCRDLEWG